MSAKKKYAETYTFAVERAQTYGRVGLLFLSGQYRYVLSARDVAAVRSAYLGAVREYGYRHGIGGLSSMLEFTEFSQLDSAQLAYEDGYREGDSVRMQALTHHLSS